MPMPDPNQFSYNQPAHTSHLGDLNQSIPVKNGASSLNYKFQFSTKNLNTPN